MLAASMRVYLWVSMALLLSTRYSKMRSNDWRRALRLDAQGTFRAVQCEALVVIACS